MRANGWLGHRPESKEHMRLSEGCGLAGVMARHFYFLPDFFFTLQCLNYSQNNLLKVKISDHNFVPYYQSKHLVFCKNQSLVHSTATPASASYDNQNSLPSEPHA